MAELSPLHVPKFGDWDVNDDNGEKHNFTHIFDRVRASRNIKRVLSNDPHSTLLNSSFLSTSPSTTHEAPARHHHQPPLSLHKGLSSPATAASILPVSYKTQSSHIPKTFGAAYTLIFDKTQTKKNVKKDAGVPPSSLQEAISPLMSKSKVSMNQKHVAGPKLGNWIVDKQDYTRIVEGLNKKGQNHKRSAQRTKKSATSTAYKPSLLRHWRLCFSSNHAVKD
ncbi:hypothetical protein GOP47_0017537 [Adiantum capillus-veneris]|uniref:RIN4 pathogenic type III effector avirulence factor Avr cleavage site domain-containing protein n=1 Tax=Adiantum capillus-veneris TaxID=13818 RepID=A0A9D4UFK5_ADICA|nr:hypothetical protein GOP47_0017537 [Adiantum capillus-veneris]